MIPRTPHMTAAIRIGCEAADVHLMCTWPECSCIQIPTAINAAVTFAIKDTVRDMTAEWKKRAAT